MSVLINDIRQRFYLDSVALMRFSVRLEDMDGVEAASMMMATPSNLQIFADAGLLKIAPEEAHADDLLIAVRARDGAHAQAAQDLARELLDSRRADTARGDSMTDRPVRSIAMAHEVNAEANLALISVPGAFAEYEAAKALDHGLNVMVFSDNVSLDAELTLKRRALDQGLLVMGPDCGTAIISGVPLGFANHVRRGDIGIVAASGTGLQEVSCLIDRLGYGISHGIGTGGRDLSSTIGGMTTFAAIDQLLEDDATASLLLISKPPAEAVALKVMDKLAAADKPSVVCFIDGAAPATDLPSHVKVCRSLTAAAEQATGMALNNLPERAPSAARDGIIVGLFSGGTLCAEAQMLLRDAGLSLCSNVPLAGVSADQDSFDTHRLLDLGADDYTLNKPHPMLEPAVRTPMLQASLEAREVAVLLLDIVIGYGADPDPAGAVAEVVSEHNRRRTGPIVVASVCGVDADPQSRQRQVATLQSAGIVVAPSNAAATEYALSLLNRTEEVSQ